MQRQLVDTHKLNGVTIYPCDRWKKRYYLKYICFCRSNNWYCNKSWYIGDLERNQYLDRDTSNGGGILPPWWKWLLPLEGLSICYTIIRGRDSTRVPGLNTSVLGCIMMMLDRRFPPGFRTLRTEPIHHKQAEAKGRGAEANEWWGGRN